MSIHHNLFRCMTAYDQACNFYMVSVIQSYNLCKRSLALTQGWGAFVKKIYKLNNRIVIRVTTVVKTNLIIRERNATFCLKIIILSPSIYNMDHPDLNVLNLMEISLVLKGIS